MVSFEIFVKAMPPSLSELKVLPSFCFAFKIPDNVAASSTYMAGTLAIFIHCFSFHTERFHDLKKKSVKRRMLHTYSQNAF